MDPRKCTLETYDLVGGAWQGTGQYSGADTVRAAPFDAIGLALDDLWAQ